MGETRKVEIQKLLDHRNICRIYDAYQDAKMYSCIQRYTWIRLIFDEKANPKRDQKAYSKMDQTGPSGDS